MKLSLFFSNSLYNCEAIIKDISGIKKYVTNFEEKQSDFLEIDVESSSFELTVIPKMPDYKSAFLDMEVQNWKDRLAQKVGNALCSTLDKMLLRVGCTYMISDTKENDIICICGQEYIFGTFDKFDLFELVPMAYMFFQASCNGDLCKCSDAFALNRKEVISSAKKLILIDFGLHILFTYPIQIGRIKKLTSDRKVKETLIKFNMLDKKEREKILNKKEEFMSR
jgi:uncharacterized lipoprotein YehR (DUF1307 family)